MARTIQSPGVEINEIDLSLRPVIPTGTTILVPGFAAQGPTEEVFEVTSFSEFETVYGKPTNPAERYFYQSAKSVFGSDARVLTTRLPYGSAAGLGYGDVYTALFYPVYGFSGEQTFNDFASGGSVNANGATARGDTANGVSLSAATDGYVLGKPTLLEMSKESYEDLKRGNFNWSDHAKCNETFSKSDKTTWGKAGIIITNKSKSTINDKYEGYYLGIIDNSQLNPATDFDGIINHTSVTENSTDLTLNVPSSRRNFSLSGTSTDNNDSVSESLENASGFDISGDEYVDTITLGVFKIRTSVFATDTVKLDYVLSEVHIGTLDHYRTLQNSNGGTPQTFFLGNTENNSAHVEVLVNKHISESAGSWTDQSSNKPSKFVRMLSQRGIADSTSVTLSGNRTVDHANEGPGFFVPAAVMTSLNTTGIMNPGDGLTPNGTYQKSNPKNKVLGAVPTKLNRIFRSLENVDAVNIDLTVEAGLGTIFAGARDASGNDDGEGTLFDDERVVNLGVTTAGSADGLFQLRDGALTGNPYNVQQNYRSVYNEFVNFAEFNRKDHMFIADPPRWIFVQGPNDKVLNDKTRTFTQFVYWPLRHIYGFSNTSYGATYGNWARRYDASADRHVWVPFSGIAAATMANSDSTYAPWFAPAGFTRGRFSGVSDLAVLPTQKHRDQLYKISINPVHQFPNEGMVIWGQKTLFKNPSAFDRINVRRLFLYLEKLVRGTMKFYVFEPNTLLTRTQVVNNLTPVFDNVKNTQGLYDYLIICDERNNTPDRIDQNELIVDIYLKPVRAAEFILVNFYATRTGQDFNELLY